MSEAQPNTPCRLSLAGDPWRCDGSERFLASAAKGVAAFELVVNDIEAACELSQGRSRKERSLIANKRPANAPTTVRSR
jgi:predicted FMN-binding regulatory protein PaiB